MTVMPIITGVLRTVPKRSEIRLKLSRIGRIETIQTRALLRSARKFRRFLETKENLLSLRLE